MSLIRQTLQPRSAPVARMLLALVLICALLVTQFGLSRHVIEHGAKPAVAALAVDDTSSPDSAGCLTCLEFQAHGSGLTGHFTMAQRDAIQAFERNALPPNTPYLAPERASQRAPPASS